MTTAVNTNDSLQAKRKEHEAKKEVRLLNRASELLDSNGDVFAWLESEDKIASPYRFKNEADAKEFIASRAKIWESFDLTQEPYIIGAENDYGKAVAPFAQRERQKEKKLFCADISRRVKIVERDIKALEGLKEVVRTFDGKVINCRFNTAVKEATDYYLNFHVYGCVDAKLNYYDNKDTRKESTIYLPNWEWITGDCMDAAKAISVVDDQINQGKADIDELQGTKKQYTEYLRKARRVEKLIEELNGYSYYIRNWAKEHDLKTYVSAGNIWRG